MWDLFGRRDRGARESDHDDRIGERRRSTAICGALSVVEGLLGRLRVKPRLVHHGDGHGQGVLIADDRLEDDLEDLGIADEAIGALTLHHGAIFLEPGDRSCRHLPLAIRQRLIALRGLVAFTGLVALGLIALGLIIGLLVRIGLLALGLLDRRRIAVTLAPLLDLGALRPRG